MIRYLRIPALIALAAFLAAGTSFAAQGQQAAGQQAAQAQAPQTPMIKGQIMEKKEIGIKNTDQKNLVVLLKTENDRRIAVDLGSTQKLKDIEIKKGDNVNVQGRVARVDDRPVLFADRLVIDGKTVEIDQMKAMQHAKTRQTQDKAREVSGEVVKTKQVELKGMNMKHMVVLMNTAKGHTMTVDLGPAKNLEQINIRQGEKISVHGKPALIGDRLVLLADRVVADGKTAEIKRAEQKKG